MPREVYGYTGKLLRVNLTDQSYSIEEIPEKVMAEYIGGRGFIAKYCYDEINPGTDPMGPDNKLFFAVGPLTGTNMPSSGRYAVGTLSPQTHAYIRSISGGAWGAQLKFAGYDMLIVEGTAPNWCYLYITSTGVEFKYASQLLGLMTEETEAEVKKELGNPKAVSCTIGPSGENQVRFACIQTERRSAGRGGCGCVMGAKKLKAIAVHGTVRPKLYDMKFNELMKDHIQKNFKGRYYNHFHDYGTTTGCDLTYNLGVLPVKNFTKGIFPEIKKLLREGIDATGYKVKDTGCYNCYMQCGSLFNVPDGPFKGNGYENPEYETMWAFGADCLNSDFAGILAANKVCDDYGVDTITTGNSVAFLMECYEKGYITSDDLNGVELKWGDPVSMVAVAKQIANRESRIGNLIADGGTRNAAKYIGHDSEDFAMHAKGLELAAYDPRGLQAHGLGYATSNIGGSHQIGYSVQEVMGFPEKVDRFSAEDKGRHTVWSQRYITIFDCAVSCGFPNAFTESKLSFDTFITWLQLVTGMNEAFSHRAKMDEIYDRIYTIERAFNLRMGLTKEDDTLPNRLMTETIEDGLAAGHVWKRDELIKDYYKVRKWDEETGVPFRPTLEELGLSYVADDLEKEGILRKLK